MGYSAKDFLGDGSTVIDEIPSAKYPKGKSYRFPSPSFERGLWMRNLVEFGQQVAAGMTPSDQAVGSLVLDDEQEVDLYREVMGDTLDELKADGVVWDHVQKLFGTLLAKHGTGRDIGEMLREAAPGERAAQPNRQARRASGQRSSRPAGSRSSRASSATKAPTGGRGSTRSSATSAPPQERTAATG